jgi:hypothetical protein
VRWLPKSQCSQGSRASPAARVKHIADPTHKFKGEFPTAVLALGDRHDLQPFKVGEVFSYLDPKVVHILVGQARNLIGDTIRLPEVLLELAPLADCTGT